MRRLPFFILSCALWLLGGCTSIQYNDYRQPVKVVTQPYGVKVYSEEGRFLGTTPGLFPVRRGREPELRLVNPVGGGERRLLLETKYRWSDSFWMNFFLVTLAPVGWGVDYLTGTAWQIEDPRELRFSEQPKVEQPPRRVAIAPTQIGERDFADALGVVIEDRMRALGKYKILNYLETAPAFEYYESEGTLTGNLSNRYKLLTELDADYVVLSKATPVGESYAIQAELKNPVTGHIAQRFAWEVSPSEPGMRSSVSTRKIFADYFHLLPNTVFLNFASYSPSMTIENTQYPGREAETSAFGDQMLRYLSTVSFANLERPRPNVRGQWTLGFVPSVTLSKKSIIFETYLPFRDVKFERLYVSGGYGGQVGYLSRYGFLYMDIVPTLTYTSLDYRTEDVSGSLAKWSVQANVELGYTYFFGEHLVGRLFVRSISENTDLWNEAFTHIAGEPIESDSITSAMAGIAIGYYIPASLTRREGWTVRARRR